MTIQMCFYGRLSAAGHRSYKRLQRSLFGCNLWHNIGERVSSYNKNKNKNKQFPQQQISVNKLANIGAGYRLKFQQRDYQLFART